MPVVIMFERVVSTVAELPVELADTMFAEVPDRDAVATAALVSVSGDAVDDATITVRGYAFAVCDTRLVRLTVDSTRRAPEEVRAAGLVLAPGEASLRAEQLLARICSTPEGVAAVSPAVESWDLAGAALTPGSWEFHVACADGSSVTVPSRSEILAALHRGAGVEFPAR